MKILSPRVHGYIDYAAVLMFALAPSLFGFGGTAAAACYVLAMVHFGISLMTAYPLGLAKVIPFTVHGTIELVVSIGLVAMPWILGFSEVIDARNFFIGSGIALFGVYMATNYKAADLEYRRRPHGRHSWA